MSETMIVSGMTIKLFDQPHTFQVRSESRHDQWHVVDLIANRHLGACTCEHMTMRLLPEYSILDGTAKEKKRFRCKHIRACRDLMMDEMILPKLEDIERDRAAF